MVKSAIRLQTSQKSPFSHFGFAYIVESGVAQVWFWNEAPVASSGPTSIATSTTPVPEPLLRASTPRDGWQLVACGSGYEATWRYAGWLVKSQWFADMPTPEQWRVFVGDIDTLEANHALPSVHKPLARSAPPLAMHVDSAMSDRTLVWRWVASMGAATLGGLIISASVYQYRLNEAIRQAQQEISDYKQSDQQLSMMRKRAQEMAQRTANVGDFFPPRTVTDLLLDLLQTGALDPAGGLSLREWEVRGNRVKMVFDVPPAEKFSLTGFLTRIQTSPSLADVRLLSPVDPQTVVLQATARPVAKNRHAP